MLFWGSCRYQRLDRSNYVCYRLQRAQLQDQEAGVLSQINAVRTLTSCVFVDRSTLSPLQCFFQTFRLMWRTCLSFHVVSKLSVCLSVHVVFKISVCLCTWSSSCQYVYARGLQDLSMSVHVVFKLSVCLCTWSSRSQYVCARGLLALNMFVYARGLQFLSMFVYARGLQALRMFASTVTMNFREIPEK